MASYVVLLRGINVGGKNKILMADLKKLLVEDGFEAVQSYIQSGNLIIQSSLPAETISQRIENLLPIHFNLDRSLIRVLVIPSQTYQQIIAAAPTDFGQDPLFRYDVIFLMGVSIKEALLQVELKDGVDECWPFESVIFFKQPGPQHTDYTKSALSKLVKKPIYQSMTIRNWKTATRLLFLLEEHIMLE